jgi:hypothetical protein
MTSTTNFHNYFDPDTLRAARDLCADAEDNTEYVRGVAELLIDTQVPQRPDVTDRINMDSKEELMAYLSAPIDFGTPERRALAFVMEMGEYLADKDEWDMEDNFATTEGLYALYCTITGHVDR